MTRKTIHGKQCRTESSHRLQGADDTNAVRVCPRNQCITADDSYEHLLRVIRLHYEEYAGVLGTTIKLRITRFKKNGRRCKGARGYIHCYHHENAARLLSELRSQTCFHPETEFVPDNFVTSRPSSVCEPRYDMLKK